MWANNSEMLGGRNGVKEFGKIIKSGNSKGIGSLMISKSPPLPSTKKVVTAASNMSESAFGAR